MIYGTNGSTLTRCNMKITYTEKGKEIDFKRVDTIRTIHAIHYFLHEDCSLLYVYLDRFNVVTIPIEDIIDIQED